MKKPKADADASSGHKLKPPEALMSYLVRPRAKVIDGSNLPLSAKHIWTPPVSRVELLTRFGTRLQSYIRPAYRASDEALALMDFRALRSADQSGGLSRPCVATEFGSAGPTG